VNGNDHDSCFDFYRDAYLCLNLDSVLEKNFLEKKFFKKFSKKNFSKNFQKKIFKKNLKKNFRKKF